MSCKSGADGLPIPSHITPSQKVEVWKKRIASFAAFANGLALLHRVAHLGQDAVVL